MSFKGDNGFPGLTGLKGEKGRLAEVQLLPGEKGSSIVIVHIFN